MNHHEGGERSEKDEGQTTAENEVLGHARVIVGGGGARRPGD